MTSNLRTRLAATVGTLLVVTVCVATAAPNTFNTALPVAQGEFIWREQLLLRERSSDGPLARDVSIAALVSVLGYGVNGRFAVFGAAPYFFERELTVDAPADRIRRGTDGFGDVTVFARYTAWKWDFTGGTFRIAPILGLTIPTGDDDASDGFGRLPRPLQTGSGAWDSFAGLVTTFQTLQYELDVQAVYRANGRHDGYAAGDEIRLDASLQYRIWPRNFGSGTPGFVYALLESGLSHRGRDEVGNRTNPNSGGVQWLLAPGLQYVGRRWIVEGTVQLPAAGSPHGDALEDDVIVRVGFRRNF